LDVRPKLATNWGKLLAKSSRLVIPPSVISSALSVAIGEMEVKSALTTAARCLAPCGQELA